MRNLCCLIVLLPSLCQSPTPNPRQFEEDVAANWHKAETEIQAWRRKLAVEPLLECAFQKELPLKRTAIKAGTGTIKGKVVFKGTPPKLTKIPEIIRNVQCRMCPVPPDKLYWDCGQTWILGKDKGVANVFVRLKVPANHYFEPAEADKKRTDTVVDQPCCAYEPHVFSVYPSYFNGMKQVPTGQELLVKNSASFIHNTKIIGDARLGNAKDQTIPAGNSYRFALNYQPNSQVNVECSIHPWMKAILFIVDHPYAVVTRLDGSFELKNVPVNTKLTLEFWHEGMSPMAFMTKEVNLPSNKVENLGDVSIEPK